MANWLEPMQQTYEYYLVDPNTWKDREQIKNVVKCQITRDAEAETLGSTTIDLVDTLGECYIRAYLVTIQNGVKERHPLSTFLVQTPSSSFNGKTRDISIDAYTPLLELKESPPPIGYYTPKDSNIMENVYLATREHVRAPVVRPQCAETLNYDFVANTNDTWLTFNKDLMANAKYEYGLDERGHILFLPKQDTASLRPVWEYNDGNSSILQADITVDHDLYGIPNVVEVVYSNGVHSYYARVVNDDPNSPISTISRGREIIRRIDNPEMNGTATQARIEEFAENLLRELSTLEYTITYTHGYCPVRLGDCVRLNYERAGLTNIKAKVVHQVIKCESGCQVTEKAIFTNKLWG